MNGGKSMSRLVTQDMQNNELITGISMIAVLNSAEKLPISKILLIEPLLSYNSVRSALSRSRSVIRSIEELVIKQNISFTNFNDRYYDSLLLSINSIILFQKMGLLINKEEMVYYVNNSFDFNTQLGNRAADRIKAAPKLAKILKEGKASDFYLSLRVKL